MIPAVIPGATRALGAPSNWDPHGEAGPCGTLPIRDGLIGSLPIMESAWRLDEAEIDALAAGGSVVLQIVGSSHPVVALYVVTDPAPEADLNAAPGVIVPDQPAGEAA